MKAKLVKEIPQREGSPYWFRKYEFECIDCGEHYFSGKCTERTNPYCPECNKKHEREKQRHYQEQKKQRAVNEVLDKIRVEIIQMPTISFNANDIYKADVLAIIGRYKQEG